MDFDLPEEIAAFRDVIRKFAAERIRPFARQWDREQNLPNELIAELGIVEQKVAVDEHRGVR